MPDVVRRKLLAKARANEEGHANAARKPTTEIRAKTLADLRYYVRQRNFADVKVYEKFWFLRDVFGWNVAHHCADCGSLEVFQCVANVPEVHQIRNLQLGTSFWRFLKAVRFLLMSVIVIMGTREARWIFSPRVFE